MSIDDCPKRAIDCTREFGKIGATLDLLLKDLAAVRDKQDDMAEQLTEIRVSAARVASQAASDSEAERGPVFTRKGLAAAIGTLVAAIGAIVGAIVAGLRGEQ